MEYFLYLKAPTRGSLVKLNFSVGTGNIGALPGVIEFIGVCKSKNLKMAVANSAGRLNMDILTKFLIHKTYN